MSIDSFQSQICMQPAIEPSFRMYKSFKIDLETHGKGIKKEFNPHLHYDEIRYILEEIVLPERFTVDSIIERMKARNKETPELEESLQEFSRLKSEIIFYKSSVERDLLSRGLSKNFAENLFNYYKHIKIFYELVLEKFDEDWRYLSYLFYFTDLPDEYLDTLAESFRIEKEAVNAFLQIIEDFRNELSSKSSLSFAPNKTIFKFSVKRLSKSNLKSIIRKHMQQIDEIIDKVGGMEIARLEMHWFINIWNAKTEKELPVPEKLTINNLPNEKFKEYLFHFQEMLDNCKSYLIDNFIKIIENHYKAFDEDVQTSWNDMMDVLISEQS